ncbi:putative LacI-family transcriptional regulator [Actinoplanes missouriensis 431]|uniref:Putative LacI-family transcriptional regulator n=1 Tax=Actinoplanes missouriensis (strain ATCC 14538 / DSM 43046 / CBS 188.64 / JCM 3121 / NBRC 102363 / NCIMB 12654 / NRRL B-3342 / UNCC 431) TaxID=512565 RepID=I0HA99_ACTM4|nr:LacI family DNA-binding transcriptional regulator [Actinoplanes missouriensis]BAL89936.1 putative LacI-family transcriptional regulator [Actinoplanes missouriensis 431]
MSATLREVAERAGVSVRTVSNVVSGFALVAPETRARVQRALDELSYRPNAAARHLRGGRSGLVALVVPELSTPYFGELAGRFADEADARSLMLLVQQTGGDPDRERELLDGVRGQVVDGLIMSPWALSPAELRRRPGGAPLVLLGEQDADGLLDHVVADNVAAARDMTRHLLGLGRTRIAVIGLQPHLHNATAARRLEGYRQALAEAGLTPDPAREVAVRRLHRADGAAAMRGLLDAGTPVDAVFCFSDQLALGALHAATERGLRVPADLAVAGFDDVEDGRYANPPLTTIAPDKAAIVTAALDCLAARLDRTTGPGRPDEPAEPRTIVVGHRLEVRASTRGPSSSR